MEYLYVKLGVDHRFPDLYFSNGPDRWVDNEREAARFTLDDRIVIEKHRLLDGGHFVKVRV